MRTFRFTIVSLTLTVVAAACGSSSAVESVPTDGVSTASAESSVTNSKPPDSSPDQPVESVPSEPTPSESTPSVDPATLPGRLAISSIGCGEFDPTNLGSGFGGDEAICVFRPDGSEMIEIPVPDWGLEALRWTWDGERLFFSGEEYVWIVDRDGTDLAQRNFYDEPLYFGSPDGAWRFSTRRGEDGFWLLPAGATRESPGWRQLTFDPDDCCYQASWAPDSARLAYTALTNDCGRVKISDLATTSVAVLTGPGSPNEAAPICADTDSVRWSPDGSAILFMDIGLDSMSSTPMIVGVDGRGLRPLLAGRAEFAGDWFTSAFAWSPDGSAVAVIGTVDGTARLFIVAVDGSVAIEVPLPEEATLAAELAWAPG